MAVHARLCRARPGPHAALPLGTSRLGVSCAVIAAIALLALLFAIPPIHATSTLELSALEDVYAMCSGSLWHNSTNWLEGDPCQLGWYGVECAPPASTPSAPQIIALNLHANGLSGSLPASIGYLPKLRYLDLGANDLHGTLPPAIGSLAELLVLNVGRNYLTGNINIFLDYLTIIQYNDDSPRRLHSDFVPLSRRFAPFASAIASVTSADVAAAHLALPRSSQSRLQYLDLHDNEFYGSIPHFLYTASLTAMDISSNVLTGEIPNDLLRVKFDLDISSNDLQCPVPDCFEGNPHLHCRAPCCKGLVQGEDENGRHDLAYSLLLLTGVSILLGALLIIVIEVALLVVVFRYRKRPERYKHPLLFDSSGEQYDDLQLDELLADTSIRRISSREITILHRIGMGVGGEVMSGTWQRPLARGGFECTDVAIKRVEISGFGSDTDRQLGELLREIKFLSALRHDKIVNLLGVSYEEGEMEIGLVTELMANGSLDNLLRSSHTLPWRLKLQIMLDTAQGMRYLHSHDPPIIHRDLKTSNLLVDASWTCKIADFGISTIKQKERTMTSIGTPIYMAPEVIKNTRYSEKADVYSFGIVLCEVWSETTPYAEVDFRDMTTDTLVLAVANDGLRPLIPPQCPSAYRSLIEDCMVERPELRPGFDEIVERLQRMQDGLDHG